jgi:hypothetical protein
MENSEEKKKNLVVASLSPKLYHCTKQWPPNLLFSLDFFKK